MSAMVGVPTPEQRVSTFTIAASSAKRPGLKVSNVSFKFLTHEVAVKGLFMVGEVVAVVVVAEDVSVFGLFAGFGRGTSVVCVCACDACERGELKTSSHMATGEAALAGA